MKYLNKYKIPFSGLSTGKHSFEFEIDDQFFACFEHSIVKNGKLLAVVELQKQENMLVVHFNLSGHIRLSCDVCLQLFEYPLSLKERIIVKFSHEEWDQDSEEVVVLSHNDYEFDITNLLYEFINVAVPLYTSCNKQGGNRDCDPEMLRRLDAEIDNDDSNKETIDPRWEALKNIKEN